ncbi:NADH-ubiquinone oxidoreductase-related protein [Artemisia annua]|uniref:NADH-ubiquinone oxidoreductase-related protein n=1 Tax=Artemisia annua TaxID=35608 RepID=A0A2U1K8P0_ARTAN|nr:NADH-ubiquinone oxidoreductase-related protein [Artemisia annua]
MGNQSSVFIMCYVSELSLDLSSTNANGIEFLLCWNAEWDYECQVVEKNAPVPNHVPLQRPSPLPEEFYKTLKAVTMDEKLEPKKDESAIPASSQ